VPQWLPRGRTGTTGYHVGGYATLSKLREQNAPGLREFTELKQGEWDLRSAGSAYIKGNRQGTLLLSGGCAKIELDKERYEQRSRSGLFEWSDRGASLRFGDTKRALTPGGALTSLPPAPAAPWKEWELQVHQESLPGIVNKFYEERKGVFDISTVTGVPNTGPNGAPVYYEQVVMDGTPLGTESYKKTVDAIGNKVEDFGALALVHEQNGGPLQAWNTDYLIAEHHTTTRNALTSDLPIAGIMLGSTSATEAFIMGTTWAPVEIARSSALFASHTAMGLLSPLMFAALTGLAAWAAAYAIENPTSPSGVAAGAVGGTAGPAAAAWTAQAALEATSAANNIAVATQAVPAPVGFLSTKILGE